MKYNYYVAGRWRNHKNIEPIVEVIRKAGKTAYCFIENEYDGHGVKNERNPKDIEGLMKANEQIEDWQTNPTMRQIFENDMQAIRDSEAIIIVFPIGFSGHIEAGAAYGMGKKCYGIGKPEKAESLYFIFEQIFPHIDDFLEQVK